MDDEKIIELVGLDGETLVKISKHWHDGRGDGMWEWFE